MAAFQLTTEDSTRIAETLYHEYPTVKRPDTDKRVRLYLNNSGSGGRFGVALPAALMAQ